MTLYRPLSRFIRRHIVDHAQRRVRCLLDEEDPLRRGDTIGNSKKDCEAWTFMMWCSALEPRARRRLWPDEDGRATRPRIVLGSDALDFELNIQVETGPLTRSQMDWLLWHAAAASLRSLWARARALAGGMAGAREAEWGPGMLEERSNLKLTGKLENSGAAIFTLEGPSLVSVLQARPRRDKVERRAAQAWATMERLEHVAKLCRGHCLRFSYADGWQTVEATSPGVAPPVTDVRRLKLFLPGRPEFYLFETSKGFCARLAERPIEVIDSAPWRAIDTLRHAVTRYERMFGPARSPELHAESPVSSDGAGVLHHAEVARAVMRQKCVGLAGGT